MNLKLLKIDKKGTDDEYILFKASDDCQLHDFLIHDDTFDSEGDISNKLRHMYRFPSLSVKKDEFVALYIKKQGSYVKSTIRGLNKVSPCHIFYWGTNSNIFNVEGDHLYLLLIAQTNMLLLK